MNFDLDEQERGEVTPWSVMLTLLALVTIVCVTLVAVVYLIVS